MRVPFSWLVIAPLCRYLVVVSHNYLRHNETAEAGTPQVAVKNAC